MSNRSSGFSVYSKVTSTPRSAPAPPPDELPVSESHAMAAPPPARMSSGELASL